MSSRMQRSVVRRPNLPLNADDNSELERLKTSPQYRVALEQLAGSAPAADADHSEGVLLHAVFEVGMATIRERAEHLGYLELAADAVFQEESRRSHRRTRRIAPKASA